MVKVLLLFINQNKKFSAARKAKICMMLDMIINMKLYTFMHILHAIEICASEICVIQGTPVC